MKRRTGALEIFSISALDLFASAMGAFALIAIILLPHYQMVSRHPGDSDALRAALLGIETDADYFVVLLDMSASMDGFQQLARDTLNNIVFSLEDGKSLQLIGFQGKDPTGLGAQLHHWASDVPPSMLDLNEASRGSAMSWTIARISEFDNGTPTVVALENALRYPAQAIILISDGAPNPVHAWNYPEYWQELVDSISQQNATRTPGEPLEIHTVAIGNIAGTADNETREFIAFMKRLADRNGGAAIQLGGN